MRTFEKYFAGAFLLFSGCLNLPEHEPTTQVSANPFGIQSPGITAKVSYAPGSTETGARVDQVGRKVLAANPQLGVKPLFGTIGSPNKELFHMDQKIIYITEGLVSVCRTDSDLAGLLAYELARMVSEREVKTPNSVRSPEQRPPIQVQIGNAASFSGGDLTDRVELAKFEKEHPKIPKVLPRPNPEPLARTYLEKAGFLKTDLDPILPFIREADNNYAFERQFKGINPNPWGNPGN